MDLKTKLLPVLVVCSLIALSGCNQADQQTGTQSAQAMSQPVPAPDHDTLHLYLGELESKVSSEEYKQLVDAIGYLKVYDTNTFTVEKFYASLDGKTPAEIIAKAEELRSKKSSQG